MRGTEAEHPIRGPPRPAPSRKKPAKRGAKPSPAAKRTPEYYAQFEGDLDDAQRAKLMPEFIALMPPSQLQQAKPTPGPMPGGIRSESDAVAVADGGGGGGIGTAQGGKQARKVGTPRHTVFYNLDRKPRKNVTPKCDGCRRDNTVFAICLERGHPQAFIASASKDDRARFVKLYGDCIPGGIAGLQEPVVVMRAGVGGVGLGKGGNPPDDSEEEESEEEGSGDEVVPETEGEGESDSDGEPANKDYVSNSDSEEKAANPIQAVKDRTARDAPRHSIPDATAAAAESSLAAGEEEWDEAGPFDPDEETEVNGEAGQGVALRGGGGPEGGLAGAAHQLPLVPPRVHPNSGWWSSVLAHRRGLDTEGGASESASDWGPTDGSEGEQAGEIRGGVGVAARVPVRTQGAEEGKQDVRQEGDTSEEDDEGSGQSGDVALGVMENEVSGGAIGQQEGRADDSEATHDELPQNRRLLEPNDAPRAGPATAADAGKRSKPAPASSDTVSDERVRRRPTKPAACDGGSDEELPPVQPVGAERRRVEGTVASDSTTEDEEAASHEEGADSEEPAVDSQEAEGKSARRKTQRALLEKVEGKASGEEEEEASVGGSEEIGLGRKDRIEERPARATCVDLQTGRGLVRVAGAAVGVAAGAQNGGSPNAHLRPIASTEEGEGDKEAHVSESEKSSSSEDGNASELTENGQDNAVSANGSKGGGVGAATHVESCSEEAQESTETTVEQLGARSTGGARGGRTELVGSSAEATDSEDESDHGGFVLVAVGDCAAASAAREREPGPRGAPSKGSSEGSKGGEVPQGERAEDPARKERKGLPGQLDSDASDSGNESSEAESYDSDRPLQLLRRPRLVAAPPQEVPRSAARGEKGDGASSDASSSEDEDGDDAGGARSPDQCGQESAGARKAAESDNSSEASEGSAPVGGLPGADVPAQPSTSEVESSEQTGGQVLGSRSGRAESESADKDASETDSGSEESADSDRNPRGRLDEQAPPDADADGPSESGSGAESEETADGVESESNPSEEGDRSEERVSTPQDSRSSPSASSNESDSEDQGGGGRGAARGRREEQSRGGPRGGGDQAPDAEEGESSEDESEESEAESRERAAPERRTNTGVGDSEDETDEEEDGGSKSSEESDGQPQIDPASRQVGQSGSDSGESSSGESSEGESDSVETGVASKLVGRDAGGKRGPADASSKEGESSEGEESSSEGDSGEDEGPKRGSERLAESEAQSESEDGSDSEGESDGPETGDRPKPPVAGVPVGRDAGARRGPTDASSKEGESSEDDDPVSEGYTGEVEAPKQGSQHRPANPKSESESESESEDESEGESSSEEEAADRMGQPHAGNGHVADKKRGREAASESSADSDAGLAAESPSAVPVSNESQEGTSEEETSESEGGSSEGATAAVPQVPGEPPLPSFSLLTLSPPLPHGAAPEDCLHALLAQLWTKQVEDGPALKLRIPAVDTAEFARQPVRRFADLAAYVGYFRLWVLLEAWDTIRGEYAEVMMRMGSKKKAPLEVSHDSALLDVCGVSDPDDGFTYIELQSRQRDSGNLPDKDEVVVLEEAVFVQESDPGFGGPGGRWERSGKSVLAFAHFSGWKNTIRVRGKYEPASKVVSLVHFCSLTTLLRSWAALSEVGSRAYHALILDPSRWTPGAFGADLAPEQRAVRQPRVTDEFFWTPGNGRIFLHYLKTWYEKGLINSDQMEALALGLLREERLTLIQGPPGTGKTSTIVALVSAILASDPHARILLCAPSNAAVDECTRRLLAGTIRKDGTLDTLDLQRILRVGPSSSVHSDCWKVSMERHLETRRGGHNYRSMSGREAEDKMRADVISCARVVCATLSGSGMDVVVDKMTPFTAVIVDEAAQAVEPETLIALNRLSDLGRMILVGDPCQLPATVMQYPQAPYEVSLFERLQVAGARCTLLATQYRMHPAIRHFPNTRFYKDQLQDGPTIAARPLLLGDTCALDCSPRDLLRVRSDGVHFNLGPYRFLDVGWSSEEQGEGGSTNNRLEASVVAAVVSGLIRAVADGLPVRGADELVEARNFKPGGAAWGDGEPFSVGVVTPYSAQKQLIRRLLSKSGVPAEAYEVNTVDGFQGREMDAIVVSTVRASKDGRRGPGGSIGFVADPRRMNVALTRARHCLLIVGDASTLRVRSDDWRRLIEDAKARNCFEEIKQKGKSPKKVQPWNGGGGKGGGGGGGGNMPRKREGGPGGTKRKLELGEAGGKRGGGNKRRKGETGASDANGAGVAADDSGPKGTSAKETKVNERKAKKVGEGNESGAGKATKPTGRVRAKQTKGADSDTSGSPGGSSPKTAKRQRAEVAAATSTLDCPKRRKKNDGSLGADRKVGADGAKEARVEPKNGQRKVKMTAGSGTEKKAAPPPHAAIVEGVSDARVEAPRDKHGRVELELRAAETEVERSPRPILKGHSAVSKKGLKAGKNVRVGKHVKFPEDGHLEQVRYMPRGDKGDRDGPTKGGRGGKGRRKELTFQVLKDLEKREKKRWKPAPADGQLLQKEALEVKAAERPKRGSELGVVNSEVLRKVQKKKTKGQGAR